MKNRILIIDDQELMRESLRETLKRAGYEVVTASGGAEGIERFEAGDFAAVITDLRMPDLSGMTVLARLRETGPETPVIVITGHGTIETAVEAIKKGAFDYITKPFEPKEIERLVEKAVGHRRLMMENESLRAQSDERVRVREMIQLSRTLRELYPQLVRMGRSSATVLIHGESGVGKEVVAKAIHYNSERADRAFLCVNCAALSAGVLESELFGHERGAFTGADRRRLGRFELADGGTILLDEISEIEAKLQSKLLRVLQEKSFERVGSSVSRRRASTVWAESQRRFPGGIFKEEAAFRVGESLLAAGETLEGLQAVERYLSAYPRGAHADDAHLAAAGARRDRLGDCAGALPHLRAVAVGRGPRAEMALVAEARCLKTVGRLDEARAAYSAYLASEPHGRFADEARSGVSSGKGADKLR